MAEQVDLAEFHIDVTPIINEAVKLKAAIQELQEEQADLKAAGEEVGEAFVDNEAALRALRSEYNKHVKMMQEVYESTARQEGREETLQVALSHTATSIKEARDQNKLLNTLRNETNVTTAQGRAELEKLNAKLDANNEFIKENADQYLKQKINIGNYKESIVEAFEELNIMNGGLLAFIGRAQAAGGVNVLLANSFKAISAAIMGAVKSTLIFLATPLGATIAVIGGALALVINYLTTTQEGIDKVTAVTRPLIAMWETLKGVAQEVGKFLFEAFENPKKSLTELYNFVKDRLISQFKAYATILEGIATMDFSKVKAGIKEVGEQTVKDLNRIAKVGENIEGRFKDAIERGVEIDALQKEIEKSEIRNKVLNAESQNELEELELIARDRNKTIAEREEALVRIEELAKGEVEREQRVIKLKMRKLELEQMHNDTLREGNMEMAELEAAYIEADAAMDRVDRKKLRIQQQLQQEGEKLRKEQIQEAIKISKLEYDLFIQAQGDKARSMQEQLELAELVRDRQIKMAEEVYNASEKKESDKLALLKATNDAQQEFIKTQTDLVIAGAERELEIFKNNLDRKLNENAKFSEEWLAQEQERNDKIAAQEEEFLKLQLEKQLITQQQFDDRLAEAQYQQNESNRQAILAQREAARQEELATRMAEFEEDMLYRQIQGESAFALEEARRVEQDALRKQELDRQLEERLISRENYNAQIRRLEMETSEFNKTLREKEKNAALDITKDTFAGIANILGKNAVLGKGLAAASALINTYQGITAGVKLGFPAAIPAVIAAATTGFKAVKDILNTKIPNAGGSGSSGSSAGGNTASLGSGIVNFSGQGVNMNNVAASGNTAVQNTIERNAGIDAETLGRAVRDGAREGTRTGAQRGLVDAADNREIRGRSSF